MNTELMRGLDDFDLVVTRLGSMRSNILGLWHYRELLRVICWRDVKIRYRQTVMGLGWAIAQPLISMIVFVCFFGKVAKMPSDGVPYPVFCYLGLLPWTYFANAVNRGSGSMVNNAHLITKVYFPRTIIPVSSALPGMVDFFAAFLAFLPLLLYFGIKPSLTGLLLTPVYLGLCFFLVLGLSLWLSAINVRKRDIGFLVPFLVQIGMFATPVFYSANFVPEKYRGWAAVNPMFGIVQAFRASFLGQDIAVPELAMSVAITVFLIVTGFFFFRATEKGLADVI